MPELAEVEFYRKEWLPGKGETITEVVTNNRARVFRESSPQAICRHLFGNSLVNGFSHGKRLLFHFSGGNWLGIHLGMSGRLSMVPGDHAPNPHDHLLLRTAQLALVFNDPRMFGQINFDCGPDFPDWWRELPPEILTPGFTSARVANFARRLKKTPFKTLLLDQRCFPGIGNWMADEICWRTQILPSTACGELQEAQLQAAWKTCRQVSRDALKIIGDGWKTPPANWLFTHRWKNGGICPRRGCHTPLLRSKLRGRTTCWCPRCQRI